MNFKKIAKQERQANKRFKNKFSKKTKKNEAPKPIYQKKTFINYKVYLMSKDWERLKKQKLNSVGSTCQICNSPNNLHIHHRTYKRIYNEKLNDLTVLCAGCHLLFHQQTWSDEKIEAEVYKKIENDYGFFLK